MVHQVKESLLRVAYSELNEILALSHKLTVSFRLSIKGRQFDSLEESSSLYTFVLATSRVLFYGDACRTVSPDLS